MIKNIILGHVDEVLNRNEALSKQRLAICAKCPLLNDSVFGKICDSKKYFNPDTKKSSYLPFTGAIHGCGCRLDAKTRRPDEHCPAKLW